jgi:beta-galactosidase
MWAYPEWQKYGLDDLRWSASDVNVTEIGAGKIKLDVMLLGKGKRDFTVTHHVIYTVTANGKLTVENQVHFTKQDIPLGRLGIRLFLNKKLDNVEYLGRGPMENYADRKSGFDIGDYSSSVMEQMTGYEKPMDCGNHEDVRWVCLTGKALHNGYGLKAFHVGEDYLQFTALPYSDEQMTPVEYKIDLPKSNATVLVIAHKTLGVGSYGCGPKPLDRFIPNSQDASFSYGLDLVNPVK